MDPDQKIIYSIVEKVVKGTGRERGRSGVLSESFDLKKREVISLTGAGGKTTLMFRLAKELSLDGRKVVTTTTTKILEPTSIETPIILIDPNEGRLKEWVNKQLRYYKHITIAREKLELGKLEGVSSRLVNELWSENEAEYIIIEADGAAGRPIKAPREWEPVIPSSTTLLIAVLGVDGVGKELNEENVFQPERVSRITEIPLGSRVTEEVMVVLITHPEGILKGIPPTARVSVLLNKVDMPDGMTKAKRIAQRIIEREHPQIERVVLGQLKHDPPVADVIFP